MSYKLSKEDKVKENSEVLAGKPSFPRIQLAIVNQCRKGHRKIG